MDIRRDPIKMLLCAAFVAAASCKGLNSDTTPDPVVGPRRPAAAGPQPAVPTQQTGPVQQGPTISGSGQLSPGCGTAHPAQQVEDLTMQVGVRSRGYLRVIPNGYNAQKPYALIFWYHGAGATPELERGIPNYNHSPGLERVTNGQAIFILPRALPGSGLTWEHDDGGPDLAFFDALYQQITRDLCIDMAKVFVIGVSNGALFANHLASQRSAQLAGVVTVALPGLGSEWEKVGIRAMLIQDDRDQFASAQQSLKKAASDAGCSVQNGESNPRQPNACLILSGCASSATPVAFCPWQVLPGYNPHDWPRFSGADDQIWNFLTGNPL